MGAARATELSDQLIRGWRAWLLVAIVAFSAALPGIGRMPVLDRDEARFAQATRQMLETGDYVQIRLQEDARNKKPIGIYWLQAGAVEATRALTGRDNAIWAYRLPSLLGAVLAALACFWAGTALLTRRAALVGSVLFAGSMLLGTEGMIAKTDGALAGVTVLAMAALARLYARAHGTRGFGAKARDGDAWAERRLALVFWAAVGAGVLIKGPVTPLVAALSLLGIGIWEQRIAWARALAWWPGPVLAALMVAPWMIAIGLTTGGAFFIESVGGDLAPKMVSGQEGHIGLPGAYLLFSPLTAFPITLGFAAGAMMLWRTDQRAALMLPMAAAPSLAFVIAAMAISAFDAQLGRDLLRHPPALILAGVGAVLCAALWLRGKASVRTEEMAPLRFLAAWLIPTWLLFEFLPTKLLHYVLPVYPALALLCGAGLVVALEENKRLVRAIGVAGFALAGLILIGAIGWAATFMPGDAEAGFRRAAQAALTGGVLLLLAIGAIMFMRAPLVRAGAAALFAIAVATTLRERILPEARQLHVSVETEAALKRARLTPNDARALYVVGYGEMSLVFLTRTDIRIGDADQMAARIQPGDVLIVEGREIAAAETALAARGLVLEPNGAPVEGHNYGNGDAVVLTLGQVREVEPDSGTE